MDAWVLEVLREGYRIPFLAPPPLSETPVMIPSYRESSMRGRALSGEISSLLDKGAVELAPTSPGFFHQGCLWSRRLLEPGDRPSISPLFSFVSKTKFPWSCLSVLYSVRLGGLNVFPFVLQDAYL